jgi:hypothetical protein
MKAQMGSLNWAYLPGNLSDGWIGGGGALELDCLTLSLSLSRWEICEGNLEGAHLLGTLTFM